MNDDARETSDSMQRARVVEIREDRYDPGVSERGHTLARMRQRRNTKAMVQKVDDAQSHIATANN